MCSRRVGLVMDDDGSQEDGLWASLKTETWGFWKRKQVEEGGLQESLNWRQGEGMRGGAERAGSGSGVGVEVKAEVEVKVESRGGELNTLHPR